MSDGSEYCLDDVQSAEARIRAEVPGVLVNRGDYDWALTVARTDKTMAFTVYRPQRTNDAGRVIQAAVVGDVDKIIANLKS